MDIYIFIHDQNILKEYEIKGKFNMLTNYKYVFLGSGDCSLIQDYNNVIIARNLPYNIEGYPKLTAFTGWYALYKNNLLNVDTNIVLLEYDIDITNKNFQTIILKSLSTPYKIASFISAPTKGYDFIKNPKYISSIHSGVKNVYNVDVIELIKNSKEHFWMCSNNVSFEYNTFIEYMKWFEPLIDEIKDDIYSGHNQERCTTFFALIKNIPFVFVKNILKHHFLDSQKTYKIKKNG